MDLFAILTTFMSIEVRLCSDIKRRLQGTQFACIGIFQEHKHNAFPTIKEAKG